MSSRGQKIRLGLFVVLTAVLFGWLIIMFGSLPTLFRRATTYVVRFTEAPGLTPGAPVRRAGVRIGEVRDVTLDEERGIVRVRINVSAPYRVRKNEQPTLIAGLLGSEVSIDLVPRIAEDGDPVDREPVEGGAELVGIRAATVGTLLKDASGVVPTTQETLNDIRKSIQRLEKLAARAERMAPLAEDTLRSYRELARRAQQSIPEAEKTNAQIQELIRSAREVVPEAQRTVEQYRQLAQDARGAIPELMKTNREVSELARAVQNAIPTVERTAEEYRDLATDVRRALPRAEKTIDEMQNLIADVRKAVPNARNAIEDAASTARSANRLIEDLEVFWKKNRDKVEKTLVDVQDTASQVRKLASEENLNKINATITNVRTGSDSLPKIAQNVTDVSDQARETVKRLNKLLEQAEKPLNDVSKLAEDARKLIGDVNKAVPDVQKLIGDVNKAVPDLLKLVPKVEKILDDVQKVTGPLGTRSEQIVRNVDESIEKVNQTLGDIRALMRVLDRADGTLRKILTDPSVYNNVDTAVSMVARMVPRIDRILKDFETFADKLARHPELLGVGGAVRPGNGLKSPPTPPMSAHPAPGSGGITTPMYKPR